MMLPLCCLASMMDFVAHLPRCFCKLRCLGKTYSLFFLNRTRNLVQRRILWEQLHKNTRIACLRTFANISVLRNWYTLMDIRKVFRLSLRDKEVYIRSEGVSMIFQACQKYGYLLLIYEFLHASDKNEFLYMCQRKTIQMSPKNPKYRDATECKVIDQLLRSGSHFQVAIALCILRSFVDTWKQPTVELVLAFQNDNRIVAHEANLCMEAYQIYSKSTPIFTAVLPFSNAGN